MTAGDWNEKIIFGGDFEFYCKNSLYCWSWARASISILNSVPLSYKNDEVTLLRLHGFTLTVNMYDRFCCLEQTRFALIPAKARLFQGSRSFTLFHTTSSKYYGVMCLEDTSTSCQN